MTSADMMKTIITILDLIQIQWVINILFMEQ